MIQIEDNDLPITVAEKLIRGKTSKEFDMFNLEELREIAAYLAVFYTNHKEED